jgi:DNA helicase-2/ATP-dependent DNA helicase PcrA
MSAAYLDKLNSDQRRAVEHGVCDPATDAAPALLVIAGAGSGKTSTLAHRVVHLAANGVDPRRILLMTFSRSPAVEMTRRVQRIGNEAFGANRSVQRGAVAGARTGALPWAGTFHAIGARLLREYATQIGLDPAFTIHDREDSADLMNLVRHDLGFSSKESRFPTKATCLAIYSRAVNAEQELASVLARPSRGAARGRTSCGRCLPPISMPSSASTCSTTTIPALLGADDV